MLTEKERAQLGAAVEAMARDGQDWAETMPLISLPDMHKVLDTYTEEEKERHVGGD